MAALLRFRKILKSVSSISNNVSCALHTTTPAPLETSTSSPGTTTTTTTPRPYVGRKTFRNFLGIMTPAEKAAAHFAAKETEICNAPKFLEDTFLYFLMCLCLIAGIYFVICGYRFFKTSMFVSGFIFAAPMVYLLSIQEQLLPHYGNVVVSTCAGFLFGLITMLIEYVGIFISGFQGGVHLSISGMTTYGHVSGRAAPGMFWQTMLLIHLISGIVTACSNLYFKKSLTILCTSVYGAALIVISLDFYIDRWATLKWVIQRMKLEPAVAPPCPLSWLILAAWAICAILGLIIQWTLTGTGIHHEESLAVQKRRPSKAAPVHLTCEQRASMRARKYRYLYQVRTAHGDVISQSYVQALQAKSSEPWPGGQGGAGECSTLQSDSTHLTVLATDPPHPDSEEDIHQIRSCR